MITTTLALLSTKLPYLIPFLGALPGYLRDLSAAKQAIDSITTPNPDSVKLKLVQIYKLEKDYIESCIITNVISVALIIIGIAGAIISQQALALVAALFGVACLQLVRTYLHYRMTEKLNLLPSS